MVESTALEMRHTRKGIVGSNPTLSAIHLNLLLRVFGKALVVVTEWDEFRALDFRRLKQEMKAPVIVDLRNIYKPEEMEKYGFSHFPIGKRMAKA